jgi:hypothetical protein
VLVIVMRSWKKIADRLGEEAIDIAENLFLNLCRFATRDADVHARLSLSVFAAYWSAPGAQRYPVEVLGRWLPMQVTTPSASVPIDAAWFVLEVSAKDAAPEVFDRLAAEAEGLMAALPPDERHEPLPGGWARQVQ